MQQPPIFTRIQLGRYVRARLAGQLYDDTAAPPRGIAIYSLSDPRDIGALRYIGQTDAPRRRLLQHLSTARLWLPDETPWWIRAPKLRPLYGWIRELFREEGRLPVMVVRAWVEHAQAREAERGQIHAFLEQQASLLNYQAQLTPRRMPGRRSRPQKSTTCPAPAACALSST
jgi:hypothetical protein